MSFEERVHLAAGRQGLAQYPQVPAIERFVLGTA